MPEITFQSLSLIVLGLLALLLIVKKFFLFKEEEIDASILGFNIDNSKDECRLSYRHDDCYGQIVMDVGKLEEFTKHKPLDKNCTISYEKSTLLGQRLKSVKVKPRSAHSPVSIYFD